MSKYKKLGLNSLVIFLGGMGSRILIFLVLPFYTKFLSPEEFGRADLIMSYISLLIPILTFIVTEAVFRLPVGQSIDNQKKYFSNSFLIGNTGFLIGILILKVTKNIVIKDFQIQNIFLIIGLLIFNVSLLQQFLKGIGKIKEYSLSGVFYSIVFVTLNYFLIKKYKLNGYFYSILFSNFFMIIYLGIFLKLFKFFDIKKISQKTITEILKYTIPLIPTSIIWWVINLSDRIILNKYYGEKILGLYTLSNKFAFILSMIFGIFYTSWQISVVQEYSKEGYKEFYKNMFKTLEMISFIFNIVLILSLRILLPYFINKNYNESFKYIAILTTGTIYANFASFIGANYIAAKKTNYAFYTGFFVAILNILLNFLLIPLYGILGASVATFISYLSFFIIRKYTTKSFVNLDLKNIDILYGIILNILVCIMGYSLSGFKIILVFLGFVVYLTLNKNYLLIIYTELKKRCIKKNGGK